MKAACVAMKIEPGPFHSTTDASPEAGLCGEITLPSHPMILAVSP